ADAGGIFLLQEDGKTMRFVVHRGLSEEFVKNVETIQLGEGISGRAAVEKKPVIMNISHYPSKRLAPFIIKEGVQSMVSVPLLAKDRVLGAINIGSRKPDAFPENKIDTLLSIGIQIGVAIQNAELLIIEQRKSKQLMTINRIGQNIASFMDVEKLFLRVVKLLRETFGYSYVTIAVVDEKANEIIYKAAAGYNIAELKKSNEKLGEEGIIQWVALSANPLLTNDVSKEPRFLYCDVFKHSRSELTLPIMLRNKVVAVLDIQSDKLNAFNPDDLSTFETVARDISVAIENARLYEELRGTTNYLENLITYANAPIIVWNLDRKITIFNRAFEKLSGYSSDEVIDRDLEILFPPADKEEILKTIDQAIKGERWETVEMPIQRKDGERRIALWNSASIIDKDGNIIATIAQGQDITERKRAEESLKESEERLRIIAETTNAVLYRLKYSDDMKYDYINPAIENLTGYNPDEINKIGFASLVEKIEGTGGEELKSEELKSNREKLVYEFPADYLIRTKQGDFKWLADRSYPWFDENGTLIGSLGILTDITQRKESEQEIISQKNKFAQLFENSPIAIALLDDQHKIVLINESFSALFGYFLEEIKGQALNDIIVPPEFKEEAKSFTDRTKIGDQVNKESYRMKKDGALVYVQIVSIPVIVNEKTVGIYGMYV
ncbi:MAG: PAS domain S-box protein, partial [Bacteroidetes bacterium]|nr:PAS domain S-box protein [Bacteroidota bacterium]